MHGQVPNIRRCEPPRMGAGYENQRTRMNVPSTNHGATSFRIKGVALEIFGTLKISLEVLLILVVRIELLFALVAVFMLRVKSRNECTFPLFHAPPSTSQLRNLKSPCKKTNANLVRQFKVHNMPFLIIT